MFCSSKALRKVQVVMSEEMNSVKKELSDTQKEVQKSATAVIDLQTQLKEVQTLKAEGDVEVKKLKAQIDAIYSFVHKNFDPLLEWVNDPDVASLIQMKAHDRVEEEMVKAAKENSEIERPEDEVKGKEAVKLLKKRNE